MTAGRVRRQTRRARREQPQQNRALDDRNDVMRTDGEMRGKGQLKANRDHDRHTHLPAMLPLGRTQPRRQQTFLDVLRLLGALDQPSLQR